MFANDLSVGATVEKRGDLLNILEIQKTDRLQVDDQGRGIAGIFLLHIW
jgi:hypothetical protein